jgi:hypothetical protein
MKTDTELEHECWQQTRTRMRYLVWDVSGDIYQRFNRTRWNQMKEQIRREFNNHRFQPPAQGPE